MNTNDTKIANGNTKSQKYADAVARATGQELAVQGQAAIAVPAVIPDGFGAMVSLYSEASLGAEVASGKLEFAPRIIKLEEGLLLEGILEGKGGDVEFEEVDPHTKQVRSSTVSTWVLRSRDGNLRASFLSLAQLEDKLPPFVGGYVKIYVGPMRETRKGTRYRDILVGGEKREDGQLRSFAKLAPIAIEVAEAPAS